MESKILIDVTHGGTPFIRIKESKSEEDVRDKLIQRLTEDRFFFLTPIGVNHDTGERVFALEPLTNGNFNEKWSELQEWNNILTHWPDGIPQIIEGKE